MFNVINNEEKCSTAINAYKKMKSKWPLMLYTHGLSKLNVRGVICDDVFVTFVTQKGLSNGLIEKGRTVDEQIKDQKLPEP